LESDLVHASDIKVLLHGRFLAESEYSRRYLRDDLVSYDLVDSARLAGLLRHGASVTLIDAHRFLPGLTEAFADLVQRHGLWVKVDIGLSGPTADPPLIHDRPHDQIYLMLAGEQQWRVWPPIAVTTSTYTVRFFDADDLARNAEPSIAFDLAPGQPLFVPRGSPYSHTTGDHPIMLLIVGLGDPTTTPDDGAGRRRIDRRHLAQRRTVGVSGFYAEYLVRSDAELQVTADFTVQSLDDRLVTVGNTTFRVSNTVLTRLVACRDGTRTWVRDLHPESDRAVSLATKLAELGAVRVC
jgi:hypothetical protein